MVLKPEIYTAAESSHAPELEACIGPRLKKADLVVVGGRQGDDLHLHVHGRGDKAEVIEMVAELILYLQLWLHKARH